MHSRGEEKPWPEKQKSRNNITRNIIPLEANTSLCKAPERYHDVEKKYIHALILIKLPASPTSTTYLRWLFKHSDCPFWCLYLKHNEHSTELWWRLEKKYFKGSNSKWHVTNPQRLHHGWHDLGKGTKMLKCLLPQEGYFEGALLLSGILHESWIAQFLSCSRKKGTRKMAQDKF